MKHLVSICLIGAAMTFPALAQSASGTALSSQGGRFVFGQVSDGRRDQYMLDTQTGRLWQMVCTQPDTTTASGCKITSLQPVTYTDFNGGISLVPIVPK